jgi:hypothetical protein
MYKHNFRKLAKIQNHLLKQATLDTNCSGHCVTVVVSDLEGD